MRKEVLKDGKHIVDKRHKEYNRILMVEILHIPTEGAVYLSSTAWGDSEHLGKEPRRLLGWQSSIGKVISTYVCKGLLEIF